MTHITNWINAKLEFILATLSGLGAVVIDTPHIILNAILAILFGFLGGVGGWLWKKLSERLKKK